MVSLSYFFQLLRGDEPKNVPTREKEEFRRDRRKAFTLVGVFAGTLGLLTYNNQNVIDLTPADPDDLHKINLGRTDEQGRVIVLETEFKRPLMGGYEFTDRVVANMVPYDQAALARDSSIVTVDEFLMQLDEDLTYLNISTPTAESLGEGRDNLMDRYFPSLRNLDEERRKGLREDSWQIKKLLAELQPYRERMEMLRIVQAKLGVLDYMNRYIQYVRPNYKMRQLTLPSREPAPELER